MAERPSTLDESVMMAVNDDGRSDAEWWQKLAPRDMERVEASTGMEFIEVRDALYELGEDRAKRLLTRLDTLTSMARMTAVRQFRAAARHGSPPAEPSMTLADVEFLFSRLPFETRHRWGGDAREFIEGVRAGRELADEGIPVRASVHQPAEGDRERGRVYAVDPASIELSYQDDRRTHGEIMETPVLKSCPFCGTVPQQQRDLVGQFWIRCSNSECYGSSRPYFNVDEAVASWNRRGAPTPDNGSEAAKLVAFFRSPEGDALGRAGDHDNLSPADTAIRAMRLLLPPLPLRAPHSAAPRHPSQRPDNRDAAMLRRIATDLHPLMEHRGEAASLLFNLAQTIDAAPRHEDAPSDTKRLDALDKLVSRMPADATAVTDDGRQCAAQVHVDGEEWQRCILLAGHEGSHHVRGIHQPAGLRNEDSARLDTLQEYCDCLEFRHVENGVRLASSKIVLHWFVGDGGGDVMTVGATWREAVDEFNRKIASPFNAPEATP